MPDTPDFQKMADAAREARMRAEQAAAETRVQELEQVANDAYLAFGGLFGDDAVEHDDKLARFRGATAVLEGKDTPRQAPVATTPADNPDILDLTTLSPEQRRMVEMITGDPKRFTMENEAIKDKQFMRRKKDAQAAEATLPASESTPSTSAEPSSPTKKKAAKKAAPPRERSVTSTPDSSGSAQNDDEGTEQPKGFLARITDQGKKAYRNAQQ